MRNLDMYRIYNPWLLKYGNMHSVQKTYAPRAMLKSIPARVEIGVTFPVLIEGDKALHSQ